MISRYKLFCFDMGGTLLDSVGEGGACKIRLIRLLGLPLPPEREPWARQHTLQEMMEYYRKTQGIAYEWDDIIRWYRALMYENYRRGIAPKPGALEFLQYLHRQGACTCVGTANDRNIAREALDRSGLLPYVGFVTDVDEIGCDKKDPEFFRRLAKRFDVQPEEILMFEDTLSAMQGAKAAGCGLIAIYGSVAADKKAEICALADRYIHSYLELL